MKHVQPAKGATENTKQEAIMRYTAKRRFRGMMIPFVVAGQVALVYATIAALSTQVAVIAALSALGWCVYSLFLDDVAVRMFNTKEYFRVLLNEATLQIQRAESEGFLLENISPDGGTSKVDMSLKEASDAEEGDVDGNK